MPIRRQHKPEVLPVRGEKEHVSMKSSRQDKIEGALDVAKGQVKKTAGTLTGDEGKKAEGRKDQIKGAAKWGRGRTKDIFDK